MLPGMTNPMQTTTTEPTSPNGNAPAADEPLDLDAELESITEDTPQPIMLGGRAFRIRRDITGVDILNYWRAVLTARDPDAWRILLADPTDEDMHAFSQVLGTMGPKRYQQAVRKMHKISGMPEHVPMALRQPEQPQGGEESGNR